MGGSTQPHDPSPLLMRMSIETSAAIISAFSVGMYLFLYFLFY